MGSGAAHNQVAAGWWRLHVGEALSLLEQYIERVNAGRGGSSRRGGGGGGGGEGRLMVCVGKGSHTKAARLPMAVQGALEEWGVRYTEVQQYATVDELLVEEAGEMGRGQWAVLCAGACAPASHCVRDGCAPLIQAAALKQLCL